MEERRVVRKRIVRFVIPVILESVLQLSASTVSTAMIGRLLPADISAQGACVRITDTFWCLFRGIAVGVMILFAQHDAAGRRKECRALLGQALCTGVPLALVLCAGVVCFAGPLLSFFSNDQELLALATEYLRIAALAFPFVLVSSFVSATFHAKGDAKTPMVIAGVLNAVNLLLGWTLIFGFGPVEAMGIRGAALALLAAQICSALVGLALLYGKRGILRQYPRYAHFRLNWATNRSIYAIGVPSALESMFWQFSAILLSKMILGYGANCFAAYQIGIQAETITEMPAIAFGSATTALVARGLSDTENSSAKAYFLEIRKISLIYSLAASIILITLATPFMRMMTTNAELIPVGALYVMIMGFVQTPQNVSRIYNGALRAAGYKNVSMLVAAIGIWGVRIPLCALAAMAFHWNIASLWLIIALDQALRFLLSRFIFQRKNMMETLTQGVSSLP